MCIYNICTRYVQLTCYLGSELQKNRPVTERLQKKQTTSSEYQKFNNSARKTTK